MSASDPFFKVPLLIFKIFAGLIVKHFNYFFPELMTYYGKVLRREEAMFQFQ